MTRKQLYRSTLWGNHYLRQYLPSYAPVQEWRFSSSWGKKPETPSSSRNKAEANEEEDWYTRWEKQKLKQYDDFIKKVEHDPYTALFGKSRLNLNREHTESKAVRTSSPSSPKETSGPKSERPPEIWPSKSSNAKISENRDTCGEYSKSETMPTQERGQEYEIDPITNRKVLKTSTSPVSTIGHIEPHVKDVEKAFEKFLKRWNLVSPAPLGRRFIMVEHTQALSSSYPSTKDTPPLKPSHGNGWLAQEGFGNFQEPKADAQPAPQTHVANLNATTTKIESALDRHLSSKNTDEKEKNHHPRLQYRPEENKTEDVDLLRPSDVRASAGLRGGSPKETDVDKQARRQKLEKSYESCSVDRTSQLAGDAASNKPVQRGEDRPAEKSTVPVLRFGSWLKGTPQDAKLKDKEASKDKSTVWVNELSDARDFDPFLVDQASEYMPVSKHEVVSKPLDAVASEAQAEARDKASKLKAQIVPLKAKLDAMKEDYDSLRQRWLQEIRRVKEKAARKEEEAKAQKVAKRAREIHEEEVKAHKVAMEAIETRNSDASTNVAKTALAKGIANDIGEKPAPRRLQSFLQGEGDMASNVHEFAGRDRWYKRKAPHAMDAKDVEMDTKLKKFATDRALIREVREIYEDTYGTIDTKHRQNQDISVPIIERSSQPIISSSGMADRHTQLPSSAASTTESSRDLDESQSSDALEIIQKLFGQLREAQSIIQDCQINRALSPSDPNNNIFEAPSAFEKSVNQIVRTSGQLARIRPGGMIDQGSIEAATVANSKKPTINRPLPTTAPKSTKLEAQRATKLNTYCILAYDSATEKVKSAEATTLAPFSKEEVLLPLDALNRLSNPGKFLPQVMSLGDKGYEPVSGTSNILVFKKEVTPEELAEIKKTDARKELNPNPNLSDHLTVLADSSIGNCDGNWRFDLITKEDLRKYRQARSRGMEAEQQQVKEAQKQAVEKVEKEYEEVEEARKTAVDGITSKMQPLEEAQKEKPASSKSPRHTSSDKVHRQEAVFSGSRQGRWVENTVKAKKSKRAAGRRRKTMKRTLMAGAFTAACCYWVGVVSEMMHAW